MNDPIQPAGSSSGLINRVKAIITTPGAEWPKIAADTNSPKDILIKYALPLMLIGPICSVLGSLIAPYGFGLSYYLVTAVVGFLLGIAMLYALAAIANFLAPKFGGKEDYASAFELVAYSWTPVWLAGVLGLLIGVAPAIALLIYVALAYGLYLFYLGAGQQMSIPKDKNGTYLAVYIVSAIILYIVIGAITTAIVASMVVVSSPAVVVYS
jgi:hypothetical protein